MKKSDHVGIITDFVADDGIEWKAWDYSAPLFDHFFIIGPRDFHNDTEPCCLYKFPKDGSDNEFRLERFLFLDGLQFRNLPAQNKDECSELFCCMPKDIEEFKFEPKPQGRVSPFISSFFMKILLLRLLG